MKLLTTSVPSKYAKFSVSVTKSLGCNCLVLSSCSCQHPCSKACCFVMWLCHLGTSKGFLLVSWPGAGGSVVLLCWGMCTSWVRTAQLRLAVLSLLWLAELLLLPAEVHPSGTLVVQRNTMITSKLTCVCKSILQVPCRLGFSLSLRGFLYLVWAVHVWIHFYYAVVHSPESCMQGPWRLYFLKLLFFN